MNVWTYWQGKRLPYIDVCLQSMANACKDVDFHLVTPNNLYDYIDKDTINPNFIKLRYPSKIADCVRAALLAKHGGWWWDSDTIGIQNPLAINEQHPDASVLYMTWTKQPRRILNGYIYMKKKTDLARQWLYLINEKLKADFESCNVWLSMGEKLLTPLLDNRTDCVEIERRLFLPIDIDSSVAKFFSTTETKSHIQKDTICFGLNHSWMFHNHKEAMEQMPKNWKKSKYLIHKLLDEARTSKTEPKPVSVIKHPQIKLRKPAKEKIAVVTLATGDYWKGAEVLFHSLEENGMPDSVSRIVLSNDSVNPTFAEKVSIPKEYDSIKTKNGQFAATAKKFAALTLDYDRIILIDSDIFCVQDCELLWSSNVSRLPFYAVHDSATFKYYPEEIRRLGLDRELMFNAGTMIYNKRLLPNLHDDLIKAIQSGECETYDGGDQGYFNAHFQNTQQEVGYLANGYNYLLDLNMPQLPMYARYLFHFAGSGLKPWNDGFSRKGNGFAEYKKAWDNYFKSAKEKNQTTEEISQTTENIFLDIYRTKRWKVLGPDKESDSGPGSTTTATENIQKYLPQLIKRLNVKSLLDIPCGDFHWMKRVNLDGTHYIGADIVSSLIKSNKNKYRNHRHDFKRLDLLTEKLPRTDLILCRDFLCHMSYRDAWKAIKNIKLSGAKYVLFTTYTKRDANRDIPTGTWYPVSLKQKPFNFPNPSELMNENCREKFPHFQDKSLGLWLVADLPQGPSQ